MEVVKGERKGRDLSPLVFAFQDCLAIFSLISTVSCQWWRSMSDRMSRRRRRLFFFFLPCLAVLAPHFESVPRTRFGPAENRKAISL